MIVRICFMILLLSSSLFADTTPVLQRTPVTFDSNIPTIQSVLGYDFGEQISRFTQMEKYLLALSAADPTRMKIQKIGESYEGRSLYYVIISSAENMSRLEDLRQANLRLSDPRNISRGEADAIIKNNPVFVCLSYAV